MRQWSFRGGTLRHQHRSITNRGHPRAIYRENILTASTGSFPSRFEIVSSKFISIDARCSRQLQCGRAFCIKFRTVLFLSRHFSRGDSLKKMSFCLNSFMMNCFSLSATQIYSIQQKGWVLQIGVFLWMYPHKSGKNRFPTVLILSTYIDGKTFSSLSFVSLG